MALGEYLGAGSTVTQGLYRLNGNATDSSGNGRNGTATNVTWVGGKIGSGAGSFNGSSSFISLPTNFGWNSTATFTASATFKLTANINPENFFGAVFLLENNTDKTTFSLRIWNTSVYYGKEKGGIGGMGQYVFTTQTNVWYNMVVITSNSVNQLYINGQLVATNTNTGNGTYAESNTGMIGKVGINLRYFPGIIDEVIIENRAWTAQEVRKYYTYSRGQFGIL